MFDNFLQGAKYIDNKNKVIDYHYLFFIIFSTAGRYHCLSKGRNGTGHLELGKGNSHYNVVPESHLM